MLVPATDNAIVLFLDLQEEIVKNSRTLAVPALTRGATVLARLARLHGIPAFVSAVPPGGPTLPAILDALDGPVPRMRTETTAFADPGLAEAIEACGRPVIVLAGVASEIVVQRTALDALAAGYEVHAAVDACGGLSQRTEDAAWRRITAAGAATTSVATFAAELAGDFSTPRGGQTLALMYEMMGG